MKKKLYLLAAFIALTSAAQASRDTSSPFDLNDAVYVFTEPHKDAPRKASIRLQLDAKKEVLKVSSTLPINELSINDLYGKKLLQKTKSNKLRLSTLPRGVYELEVQVEGTTFRKRIILQ